MEHWVVMSIVINNRLLWRWGKVGNGAGFTEVVYTLPDGVTVVPVPTVPNMRPTYHLFTYQVTAAP